VVSQKVWKGECLSYSQKTHLYSTLAIGKGEFEGQSGINYLELEMSMLSLGDVQVEHQYLFTG
jgi:hypothetical protein